MHCLDAQCKDSSLMMMATMLALLLFTAGDAESNVDRRAISALLLRLSERPKHKEFKDFGLLDEHITQDLSSSLHSNGTANKMVLSN